MIDIYILLNKKNYIRFKEGFWLGAWMQEKAMPKFLHNSGKYKVEPLEFLQFHVLLF